VPESLACCAPHDTLYPGLPTRMGVHLCVLYSGEAGCANHPLPCTLSRTLSHFRANDAQTGHVTDRCVLVAHVGGCVVVEQLIR